MRSDINILLQNNDMFESLKVEHARLSANLNEQHIQADNSMRELRKELESFYENLLTQTRVEIQ